jgi:hypothetical protein
MVESRIQVGASQDNLEIVLNAYFMLQLRKRQEDDAAAMLMLGIL